MMKFKWSIVVLGTIGFALCATTSLAAEDEPAKAAGSRMARIDTNGDGVISAEEFPGQAEVFTKLDTDGDGSLTKEELAAGREQWRRKHAGPRGEGRPDRPEAGKRERGKQGRIGEGSGPRGKRGALRGDVNGDGVIDLDEFQGPDEVFTAWDTDEDGSLSREEIAAGWAAGRQERGLTGRPGRPGPEGPVGPGKVDADGDGLISREEFPGADEVFDRLDQDGDGFISREERAAARPPHREGPPPRRFRDRPPEPGPDEPEE